MKYRNWVLPVILAAMAARAFMPSGFMVTTGDGLVASTMCSQDKSRRERIEIPGEQAPGQHRGVECKHCLSPVFGTPFAFLGVESSPLTPLISTVENAQLAWSPLLRAQSARAPPPA